MTGRPGADLAPLEYRYVLDAAMPRMAAEGSSGSQPLVLCNVPALADEVRQRLPLAHEGLRAASSPPAAHAALWIEPLTTTWRADLAALAGSVRDGGRLIVIASQPLSLALAERRAWQSRQISKTGPGGVPIGTRFRGLPRLLAALAGSGFRIEGRFGLHPVAVMAANLLSRQLERLHRPDLGDRLHFWARLHYCAGGPMGWMPTVALVTARKEAVPAQLAEMLLAMTPGRGRAIAGPADAPIRGTARSIPISQMDARAAAATAAVARLDAWFETMRSVAPGSDQAQGSRGYGGPVAHWWQQSFLYTGPGLDWRCEGIIIGYLHLWERTQDGRWLAKARRAGDDLVESQLESANFPGSAFELNPAAAGTPHEAACDLGLLRLALALREANGSDWEKYAACAERNLRNFYLGQMWNAEMRAIGDHPRQRTGPATFVPNKAATACEALFLMAEVSGDARWVEEYALPTLRQITDHQVGGSGRRGDLLAGAIAQNSLGAHRVEKYFPIYNARCIPALLQGYRWTGDERYAECALRAMAFIVRWARPDGSLPTVIYPDARINASPSWVAPLGDVLRAADELAPLGFTADLSATWERLLAGQDESGGIQTAQGFARQGGGPRAGVSAPLTRPDVRDVLHVVGWCDKAFRFLAAHAGPHVPHGLSTRFEVDCEFRGQAMHLVETPDALEITSRGAVSYQWRKGETWPQVASPEFWLR